jgi:hypothetical protein
MGVGRNDAVGNGLELGAGLGDGVGCSITSPSYVQKWSENGAERS